MDGYVRPTTLDAALEALEQRPHSVLAGGTDHYPLRANRSRSETVLDISNIPGLGGIEQQDSGWRIGCLTTWTDIVKATLPPDFLGLKQAARQVGGVQIQNAGTIVGNLCNASPAADGIPCLLALDASIELASARGRRTMRLSDFITGPRQTQLRGDELAIGLHIPARNGIGSFEKLGARAYLVISIAMVSAWARLEDGVISDARIAIGACGPRAILLPELAAALIGQRPADAVINPAHLAALTPIDDIRAPAPYRRSAALELVRRAIANLATPKALAA